MKDINKIETLPLLVINTFGHCGGDYFGNLFYGNKQILKIPALSFFRKIHILKKKNIELNNIKNNNDLYKIIKNNFLKKSPITSYNFFLKKKHQVKFKKYFFQFISKSKIKSIKKKIFLAIHYGIAKAYNINFSNLKYIFTHEHRSNYCKEYKKYFLVKFISVIRDPRATFAGSFRGAYLNNVSKEFSLDRSLMNWKTALDFFNLENKNKNIFLVKNEEFQSKNNLKKILKKICSWSGLKFNNNMLIPKYFNSRWFGDSVYLSNFELTKSLPKNYYMKKNVIKRWKSQLSNEEVLDIENVLFKSMKYFGYKLTKPVNFKTRLNSYFNILFKYKSKRSIYKNLFYTMKNTLRRILIVHKTDLAFKLFDLN